MAKILLATPDEGFGNRLQIAFDGTERELHHTTLDLGDLTDHEVMLDLTSRDPDIITLGPDLPLERALGVVRLLDDERPDIGILLVAEPTTDTWERAIGAGARAVIAPDSSEEHVRGAIDLAMDRLRRDIGSIGNGDGGSRRRVVVVAAPKGGVGKTMLSTNLSYGLNRVESGNVALVDLDLQFGDVATALGLTQEYSSVEAISVAGDPTSLKALLARHESGLWALCGPAHPVDADQLSPEAMVEVITTLSAEFPTVVIDTGPGLDDYTLSVIEMATDLVLVSTTDVAAINGLRKGLDALDECGLTKHRRYIVLNRAAAKVNLRRLDVEEVLGRRVDAEIPSSRAVPTAMNEGAPVLAAAERSPVGRALNDLVGALVANDANDSGHRWPWKKGTR